MILNFRNYVYHVYQEHFCRFYRLSVWRFRVVDVIQADLYQTELTSTKIRFCSILLHIHRRGMRVRPRPRGWWGIRFVTFTHLVRILNIVKWPLSV